MTDLSDDCGAQRGWRGLAAWAPAAAIGLGALSVSLAAEAGSQDGVLAAGVFPPWWSQSGVLAAAARAGDITAVGAAPFIVVIRSAQGPAAPRLHAAGALFSLRPGLAGLCGV